MYVNSRYFTISHLEQIRSQLHLGIGRRDVTRCQLGSAALVYTGLSPGPAAALDLCFASFSETHSPSSLPAPRAKKQDFKNEKRQRVHRSIDYHLRGHRPRITTRGSTVVKRGESRTVYDAG